MGIMQSPTGERRRRSASPLRGRYLVRNPVWNAWLRANDAALHFLTSRAEPGTPARSPGRLLVAVGGHLGDAVIATSVFAPLRSALPHVEIGVLTGSWNRAVFEGHPDVRWVHLVDHWKLDRSNSSLLSRWWKTRRTSAEALTAVRKIGYDAAIDLYAYYPNSAWLLWQADIPIRIGYTSGGLGPLYSHPVEWRVAGHVSDEHRVLVRQLLPERIDMDGNRYALPAPNAQARAAAHEKLRAAGIAPRGYVVFHPGAGSTRKEWPVAGWNVVASQLATLGISVVITGAGPAQCTLADRIAGGGASTVNMCDRLSWDELRSVLADARAVVSVDTVAMHLAAAAGVRCVALMTGMDDPARWAPVGDNVHVLTESVPCSPCYRSNGSAAMSCVRDITPETVLTAVRAQLGELSRANL